MFTLLCNSHHHPFPEFFTFLNGTSVPIKHLTPHCPSPPILPTARSLASTSVLSHSLNLTFLGTSYKWGQTVYFCTSCILECILKLT